MTLKQRRGNTAPISPIDFCAMHRVTFNNVTSTSGECQHDSGINGISHHTVLSDKDMSVQ